MYDIFDADKASKADTVIDEAVARAFVAHVGFKILDPNRVVEIFKLYSPKTDDDDDDLWHLDYFSIAVRLKEVCRNVPFFYALVNLLKIFTNKYSKVAHDVQNVTTVRIT